MLTYKKLALSALLIITGLCSLRLAAAPHINGRTQGPKIYPRPIPDITRLQKAGVSQQGIAKSLGTTGTHNIAVLLVEFSQQGSNTSGSPLMTQDDIVGLNSTFAYLPRFYREASYEKLDVSITFHYSTGSATVLNGTESPYRISENPMSYYAPETKLVELITDSLDKAAGAVKHTNAAGSYNGVIIAHAGYGAESTTNNGDIWSVYISWGQAKYGFTDGMIVPVKEKDASPIGVTCHEFGHYLGLWDLYTTPAGASQVGVWSLMDYGPWMGSPAGAQPSHPSIWEKAQLGWVAITELSSGTHNLDSYAFETSSATAYKLNILDVVDEFYLVCHTSRTAMAPYLPGAAGPGTGSGLQIWHIDEGIIDGTTLAKRKADNSLNNYSRRTVDFVEADSTDPSVCATYGNVTDLWPGTRKTFNPPYSNAYDGRSSLITVSGIVDNTDYSAFTVTFKPCISGYVKDSSGAGIKDVVVTATSGTVTGSAVTDSAGYYMLFEMDSAQYTVTPLLSGWRFLPETASVDVLDRNADNVDFRGVVEITYNELSGDRNRIMPVNNLFTPGSEVTTIYYKIVNQGRVTMTLYTLDGRFVKRLLDEDTVSGLHSVEWDGRNDSGMEVASGIYLLHINAAGYKETKKICVIR